MLSTDDEFIIKTIVKYEPKNLSQAVQIAVLSTLQLKPTMGVHKLAAEAMRRLEEQKNDKRY